MWKAVKNQEILVNACSQSTKAKRYDTTANFLPGENFFFPPNKTTNYIISCKRDECRKSGDLVTIVYFGGNNQKEEKKNERKTERDFLGKNALHKENRFHAWLKMMISRYTFPEGVNLPSVEKVFKSFFALFKFFPVAKKIA